MNKIKSIAQHLKLLLILLLIMLLTACGQSSLNGESQQNATSDARVEAIEIVNYKVDGDQVQLKIKADLGVQLDPSLASAALHGVPLYFVYEVKITEPWLFFFEKELGYQSQEWRIDYQPFLRQWSVNDGKRASQEISLEDSLEHISSANHQQLNLSKPLEPNKKYTAKLRLHLDTTQLPGAFQFNLFNFRSIWSLSSEWQNLIFQTST